MRLPDAFTLSLLLTLCLSACSPNKEVEERHLKIMVIHDEVMPMMPELRRLEKRLMDSIAIDSVRHSACIPIALELKQAQDMMWDWMNLYKKPESGGPETMTYLEEQEKAIRKVSSQMTASRDAALKLLQQ